MTLPPITSATGSAGLTAAQSTPPRAAEGFGDTIAAAVAELRRRIKRLASCCASNWPPTRMA